MAITAQPYSEDRAQAWDRFIQESSRNGTMFHERNFLEYHPRDRFRDASLFFLEDGRLVGVLPAARMAADGAERIVSHPGSSAGGLVFHRRHGTRQVQQMLESAIALYRESGAAALELRLAEPIFSAPCDGELPFCLWQMGFQMATREISSCVNLREADWADLGRSKNPGDIRRLQKLNTRVLRLDTPELSYQLIEHNLDERYQKRPTHSLDELLELKRRYPGRIDFWVVLHEELPVGTVVVFQATGRTVHDFYIAQNHELSQLQAMPLLFYSIFEHYRERGFEWFNLGISSRGDWIKWGILEFKERMGGRGICRDSWVLELPKG
jgi:hypothetical protein